MVVEKSRNLLIAEALAEFQGYLTQNIGTPINLATIGAFGTMVGKIVAAINESD